MIFKIVRALDNKIMMQTEDESCIYDAETIAGMKAAGYKAYKNGRVYDPKKARKTFSGCGQRFEGGI